MSVIVIFMINCKALWQIHCDKCTNISFAAFHRSSYLPMVGETYLVKPLIVQHPKSVGIRIIRILWNKYTEDIPNVFLPYYTCSAAVHWRETVYIKFSCLWLFCFWFFSLQHTLSKFYDLGLWNTSMSRFDILENAWPSVGKSTCLPEEFFFLRPQKAGQQGFVMFPWQSSTLSYNVRPEGSVVYRGCTVRYRCDTNISSTNIDLQCSVRNDPDLERKVWTVVKRQRYGSTDALMHCNEVQVLMWAWWHTVLYLTKDKTQPTGK